MNADGSVPARIEVNVQRPRRDDSACRSAIHRTSAVCSHQLTEAFRRRLAEPNAPAKAVVAADPDAVVIRNNRRVRAARPQSS